jgi:hypothetical protein
MLSLQHFKMYHHIVSSMNTKFKKQVTVTLHSDGDRGGVGAVAVVRVAPVHAAVSQRK